MSRGPVLGARDQRRELYFFRDRPGFPNPKKFLAPHMAQEFRTFKEVLQSRGWTAARGDGKQCTHLLMDRGRVHVPLDHEAQFLNEYTNAVVRDLRPAVVELRTPVFKLFMDFDICVSRDDVDLDPLWAVVQAAAVEFFDTSSHELIICTAPPKRKDDGAIKRGYHIYWPAIYVKDCHALAFRDHLIPKLRDAFRDDAETFVNSWEEIVDKAVYMGSGLRMPWSRKSPKEERAYVPSAVCDDVTFELTPVPQPIKGVAAVREWVHRLSIRTDGTVKATPVREEFHVEEPEETAGGRYRGRGGGGARGVQEYVAALPKLLEALPDEYFVEFGGRENVHPESFFKASLASPYSVMLRSACHFCRNIGRCHKSNNVYFVVSRGGITQRCYDVESCRYFETDILHALEDEVINVFLPAHATAPPVANAAAPLATLPCQKTKSTSNLSALLSGGVRSMAPKRMRR